MKPKKDKLRKSTLELIITKCPKCRRYKLEVDSKESLSGEVRYVEYKCLRCGYGFTVEEPIQKTRR